MSSSTTLVAAAGVPTEIVDWLDQVADKQCSSRSAIVRQILRDRMEREVAQSSDSPAQEAKQ